MKIGQEVVVKDDFKINTTVSEKVKTVKKGDRGYIDSEGFIHITTGNCKGKILKLNDVKFKGYDYENISKMVFDRLKSSFEIEKFLIAEEIESKYLIEEIEDILRDIL